MKFVKLAEKKDDFKQIYEQLASASSLVSTRTPPIVSRLSSSCPPDIKSGEKNIFKKHVDCLKGGQHVCYTTSELLRSWRP